MLCRNFHYPRYAVFSVARPTVTNIFGRLNHVMAVALSLRGIGDDVACEVSRFERAVLELLANQKRKTHSAECVILIT